MAIADSKARSAKRRALAAAKAAAKKKTMRKETKMVRASMTQKEKNHQYYLKRKASGKKGG